MMYPDAARMEVDMNRESNRQYMPCAAPRRFPVCSSLQRIIGEDYALRHKIIVLKNEPQQFEIAMKEPSIPVMDDLRKALPRGKQVLLRLASHDEIEVFFTNVYDPFYYYANR